MATRNGDGTKAKGHLSSLAACTSPRASRRFTCTGGGSIRPQALPRCLLACAWLHRPLPLFIRRPAFCLLTQTTLLERRGVCVEEVLACLDSTPPRFCVVFSSAVSHTLSMYYNGKVGVNNGSWMYRSVLGTRGLSCWEHDEQHQHAAKRRAAAENDAGSLADCRLTCLNYR
jgi:hypothetical protein